MPPLLTALGAIDLAQKPAKPLWHLIVDSEQGQRTQVARIGRLAYLALYFLRDFIRPRAAAA
jgi:hypothetical protein